MLSLPTGAVGPHDPVGSVQALTLSYRVEGTPVNNSVAPRYNGSVIMFGLGGSATVPRFDKCPTVSRSIFWRTPSVTTIDSQECGEAHKLRHCRDAEAGTGFDSEAAANLSVPDMDLPCFHPEVENSFTRRPGPAGWRNPQGSSYRHETDAAV
jgi:hypothetical protein